MTRPDTRRASTPLVPRVHVVWRPGAARAVIIRRGPTLVSATYGWDLDHGRIELAQMLRARMSPFHCDLSSDGTWLYYFAFDGRREPDPAMDGGYGALARAPWLKAVKYWERPMYDGARMFNADDQLRKGDYRARLVRDGWTIAGEAVDAVVLRRTIDGKAWLEKIHHGPDRRNGRPARFHDTHRVVDRRGAVHDQAGWDWADVRDGRLYWTAGGLLHQSTRIGADGAIDRTRVLHDFRAQKFTRIEAPY